MNTETRPATASSVASLQCAPGDGREADANTKPLERDYVILFDGRRLGRADTLAEAEKIAANMTRCGWPARAAHRSEDPAEDHRGRVFNMYTKVFESMFDGTLATKGPWQAIVTFQQMLILADPMGVVDMTAGAIARRTTVPLEIIEAGIIALEAPDPDSRISKDDGRRIVRLDDHRSWGWQIVNFVHYRNLQSNEDRRTYQRELMRRRRAAAKGTLAPPVSSLLAPLANVSDVRTRKTHTQYEDKNKDKTTDPKPDGFSAFWKAWPTHHRKAARKQCFAKWCKDGLEAQASAIVAHVEAMKSSPDWTKNGGEYVPSPLVYLNQARFEAPMHDAPAPETEADARSRRYRQAIG